MMRFYLMMKISQAVGRGDSSAVISNCERILESYPRDLFALAMLAEYSNRLEQQNKAIEYAKQALEIDPNSLSMSRLLADIYYKLEEYDHAYDYVNRALSVHPTHKYRSYRTTPLSWLIKIVALLPKYRGLYQKSTNEFKALDAYEKEWLEWAQEYKTWYEEKLGRA